LHELAILVRHRQRADGVEQQIHGDAGPAALGQRVRDVPRGGSFLENVLRIVDGLSGALDGVQLGGKYLVPVQEDLHAVARDHRRAAIGGERRGKRGVARLERRKLQDGVMRRASGARAQGKGDGERCPSYAREAPDPHASQPTLGRMAFWLACSVDVTCSFAMSSTSAALSSTTWSFRAALSRTSLVL